MNKEQINKILEKIENDEIVTEKDLDSSNIINSKPETNKDDKSNSESTTEDTEKKTDEDLTAEELANELHSMEIKTNGKPVEACKPVIIPCANDLKISAKKYTGEYILEEDCCTAITMILKNDGDLGISFMGAHNLDIVKMVEKNWKQYFKKLKKTLKQEQKTHTAEDDIKVVNTEEN